MATGLFGIECVSFVNVYQFLCVLLSLLIRGWDVGFDCINSYSLPYFLLIFYIFEHPKNSQILLEFIQVIRNSCVLLGFTQISMPYVAIVIICNLRKQMHLLSWVTDC